MPPALNPVASSALPPEQPELSVIVPFYNEAECIPPLLEELRDALLALGPRFEVIAVNDGSVDNTGPVLQRAAAAWPQLRVEHLTLNCGQAAALRHGFRRARGNWLAMLDGDGQNPPEELVRLWSLRESADMVAGARIDRQDAWLRRGMSRLANAVRRRLLRDGVTDTGCSLKLFRREVAGCFLPIRTMYSFLPAFAVAAGFSVREVPVAHRPRRAGVSHYGLRVMAITPLLDLITLCWILRRLAPRTEARRER